MDRGSRNVRIALIPGAVSFLVALAIAWLADRRRGVTRRVPTGVEHREAAPRRTRSAAR